MKIINRVKEMQTWAEEQRLTGKKIGFVPTMGALHEGHLSLVREAGENNHFCVVSIFVNPRQFGKGEDFEKYPRNYEEDYRKLASEKVDVVFSPENQEIYPQGYKTMVTVEDITTKLCGKFRPGHFDGVTTVVAKLFNLVKPHRAYFGEKDFQQVRVIRKMVDDLNLDLEIIPLPIVRDTDGLALSSRNVYLSPEERSRALSLSRSLRLAAEKIKGGEIESRKIKEGMNEILKAEEGLIIDYLSICDPLNFDEVEKITGETLIALRVRIGKTVLIDNCLIRGKK